MEEQAAATTYILFAFDAYYPAGGTSDIQKVFTAPTDTHAIAQAAETLIEANHNPDYWELAAVEEDSLRIVRSVDGNIETQQTA